MPDILSAFIQETWFLLQEMGPYLLLGFAVAGVLHILIPDEKVYRHFSGSGLGSVIKASLFGVPLPLCSCGVIPVTAHLRKQGAGKGATVSFLSSTPTTGVDSIMATYGLLGPLFAVIRPLAAFFAGFLSGSLVNRFDSDYKTGDPQSGQTKVEDPFEGMSAAARLAEAFRYGFVQLLGETTRWLVIGILLGGLLGAVIPHHIIERYLGSPLVAYPVMLGVGIVMYVCATGSIPIAASLIAKGMTPGAGLIFLIVGPATNTATLTFVAGKLGKRALGLYLAALSITALVFGLGLDFYYTTAGGDPSLIAGGMKMLPGWLKTGSAVVLIGLMVQAYVMKKLKNKGVIKGMGTIITVSDMTCDHCKMNVEGALKALDGVESVAIDLNARKVEVTGSADTAAVIKAVKEAGYSPEEQ